MKYELEIEIERNRDELITLFDNTENLKKWMPGLVSFEHLKGVPGEVGAQSKLVMSMGKRNCEMVETITVKDLPNHFDGIYETDGMWNSVKNQFIEVDESKTKWRAQSEFKSDKFMMKMMMLLMPGAFKKESLKFMNSFKRFAEERPAQ